MLAKVLIAVVSIAIAAFGAPRKVTDESLRIKVLRTIFGELRFRIHSSGFP